MIRSRSEVVAVLGEDRDKLREWTYHFADLLSATANPPKGQTRMFNDEDVLKLLFIQHYWEDASTLEAITAGINGKEHLEAVFLHILYNHTPLLQDDVPEVLEDPSASGLLVSPRIHFTRIEVARSYRRAADSLWDRAMEVGAPRDECLPMLFAYRHALELYLKLLGCIEVKTHNLNKCLKLVEEHYEKRIPAAFRNWIQTLHEMDETGCDFRYESAENWSMDGQWLNLYHFKYAMHTLMNALDASWLIMHNQENQHRCTKAEQTSPRSHSHD